MNGKEWALRHLFRVDDPGAGDADDPAGSLAAFLGRLRAGDVQRVRDLEVVPLRLEGPPGPRVALAHEAIAAGTLTVRECDGGVVQQLEASNSGPEQVLIPEGDTLVGARQNRVVAHSVLLAAGVTRRVPVGCMEQGRWDPSNAAFRGGAMRLDPVLRSGTSDDRRRARSAGGAPSLEQRRLWSEIDRSLASLNVRSDTSDYHELLSGLGRRAAELAREFVRERDQVGLIATSGRALLGIELTANPETWAALEGRTLPGYLLAAERRSAEDASPDPVMDRNPAAWIDALRNCRLRVHPALDLGRDLELSGPGVAGWALWYERHPVYLAAYPTPPAPGGDSAGPADAA